MKRTFTSLMWVGLLLSLGTTTVLAVENGPALREFKFELTDGYVGSPTFYPEMTHVAEFHLARDREFDTWLFLCEETPEWNQISVAQREFCTKLLDEYLIMPNKKSRASRMPGVGPYTSGKTPKGHITYRIWGVSLEDAKITTMAVINRLDWIAASELEAAKEDINNYQSTLLETAKKGPELEAQFREQQQKVAETSNRYSQSNYNLAERGSPLFEHAVKTRDDVASHLREVRFELLGLTAKQEAIESFKNSDKTTHSGTLLKLDQLLVMNEIERVGALARKSAYQEAFGQAKELVDAVLARDSVRVQLHTNDASQSNAEKRLQKLEAQMKSPPAIWKPVEVHDNLIRIMPVRH